MQAILPWQHYHAQLQLPSVVKSWLLDEQSLTKKLVRASNNNFRVQRIQQFWGMPSQSEKQALGLKPRDIALIREVFLLCNEQPWVYARSILPYKSLCGPLRFLRQLNNSSLGSALFKYPHLQRQTFDVAVVNSKELAIDLAEARNLYARRSVFSLSDNPVLVAEYFLPDSPLYAKSS